ncbi:hypothetical protein Nepgr_023052 [Nepenthes gracilis]|uniref:Uncharacterized protein n=1 Tax=Nepenthes gracilis TaxID=150966 RepID=A0AAD3XYQ8_NEPGR|nr:hypothetical protein Nepgr_023052 [Nepenthes gracilis]
MHSSPAAAAGSEDSWREHKHTEPQHQFNSTQINGASKPGPQQPGHSTSAPSSNSRADIQGQLHSPIQTSFRNSKRQHLQHLHKVPVATNNKVDKTEHSHDPHSSTSTCRTLVTMEPPAASSKSNHEQGPVRIKIISS